MRIAQFDPGPPCDTIHVHSRYFATISSFHDGLGPLELEQGVVSAVKSPHEINKKILLPLPSSQQSVMGHDMEQATACASPQAFGVITNIIIAVEKTTRLGFVGPEQAEEQAEQAICRKRCDL
jgi:hypothetical protein